MNGGPTGFHNAPVTRSLCLATALFTIPFGFGSHGPSRRLGLSYQDIFQELRIWRIISSLFTFSSTPELMFGLGLLYYFRVFERQIGSSKYAVFVIFSVIVSLLFQILALGYLKEPFLSSLASGPYGLIFASYIPFFFDIPISSRLRIFGIRLSNKSFIYLAGLQLLFSSWKVSVVPGLCGILVGSLYRLNTFGIRKLKFPDVMTSLFSRSSRPFSSNFSRALSSGGGIGNTPSYPGQLETLAAVVEPSETSIAMLVSMGFEQNSARQALIQARNDVNAATALLLEGQPH